MSLEHLLLAEEDILNAVFLDEIMINNEVGFFHWDKSDFINIQFQSVSFKNGTFSKLNFKHCKFQNCTFDCIFMRNVSCEDCLFENCNFCESKMNDSTFNDCMFRYNAYYDSVFRECVCHKSEWISNSFAKLFFTNVDFSYGTLKNNLFETTDMHGSDLHLALLEKNTMSLSILKGVTLNMMQGLEYLSQAGILFKD